jgi:hypothetical protein
VRACAPPPARVHILFILPYFLDARNSSNKTQITRSHYREWRALAAVRRSPAIASISHLTFKNRADMDKQRRFQQMRAGQPYAHDYVQLTDLRAILHAPSCPTCAIYACIKSFFLIFELWAIRPFTMPCARRLPPAARRPPPDVFCQHSLCPAPAARRQMISADRAWHPKAHTHAPGGAGRLACPSCRAFCTPCREGAAPGAAGGNHKPRGRGLAPPLALPLPSYARRPRAQSHVCRENRKIEWTVFI